MTTQIKLIKRLVEKDDTKKLIKSSVENDNIKKAYKKSSGKPQHL